MGIAVCGSGIGTFLFAPINRLLLELYDWHGAFLVKAAIVLNLGVCASLLRPVPIEPSEILKRKRKFEKDKKEIELKAIDKTVARSEINETELQPLNHNKDKLASNIVETTNENSSTFDLALLKNILFIVFAISNFFISLGFNAPFIFINDQAVTAGMSKTEADWILQTIGISNVIGRIVIGFLSDFKSLNRLYLYSILIIVCGVATIIEPFLKTFVLMIIYAFVFGFTSGIYI